MRKPYIQNSLHHHNDKIIGNGNLNKTQINYIVTHLLLISKTSLLVRLYCLISLRPETVLKIIKFERWYKEMKNNKPYENKPIPLLIDTCSSHSKSCTVNIDNINELNKTIIKIELVIILLVLFCN